MGIFLNVLLLILGFVLLIKGADFFVEGASNIADKFGISQLVIGLTIVAFGTSAPEAAISIGAGIRGSAGIAVGNILGSNIMNILLILGITSCIVSLNVDKSTIKWEMPFMVIITVVTVVIGGIFKELTFITGIILWVFFIIFFVHLIKNAKSDKVPEEEEEIKKVKSIPIMILMTLGGLIAIVIGSNFTVDSASYIAKEFGMSERLIGLTIVAFGTSLPELITSVTAGIKGKADIAVGNIIGSNIFNILFVLGTTCLIKTVSFEANFIVDGIVAIAAAAILLLAVIKDKKLKRSAGIFMLVGYAAYFAYLVIFAA